MKMKKFINAPETITDEELMGLGLAYPDIVEVDGEIIGTLPVKVEILPSQINVLHDYGSTHSARIDID